MDGNGILTSNEMQFFYEEQLHRMECMAQEPVLFEDILCQIFDMIGPEVTPGFLLITCLFIECLFFLFFLGGWGFGYLLYAWPMVAFDCVCLQNEGYVTLRDVKSSKLSGHVFNILFNLNKFIAFESRDAFLIRQVNANSYILIFASIQGIVLW